MNAKAEAERIALEARLTAALKVVEAARHLTTLEPLMGNLFRASAHYKTLKRVLATLDATT